MSLLAAKDTRAPQGLDKNRIKEETAAMLEELAEMQNLLYAEGKHAVLVILQGMDASGKDGVIRNVFGKLNPQGVGVVSFKIPTDAEKAHDFLWRVHLHAPAKGMIQLFNRSHYEDVLITRVHGLCDEETAQKRFAAINHFEELLTLHNNTVIFKFYLHLSLEAQAKNLAERLKDPTKHWKHNPADAEERKRWSDYRRVYEEAIAACNVIPWTIVPADQNWYKQYLITKTVLDGLKALKMKYPKLKKD